MGQVIYCDLAHFWLSWQSARRNVSNPRGCCHYVATISEVVTQCSCCRTGLGPRGRVWPWIFTAARFREVPATRRDWCPSSTEAERRVGVGRDGGAHDVVDVVAGHPRDDARRVWSTTAADHH